MDPGAALMVLTEDERGWGVEEGGGERGRELRQTDEGL